MKQAKRTVPNPLPTRPGRAGPWPSAETAVAAILLGQRFANDRLHFTSRIVLLLTISLLLSLAGNVAMFPNPPLYRYVPISQSGVILPQVPLDRPNHDDQFVVDWTIDAMTRLYSFDFLNYRTQFQDSKKNLTAQGWVNFEEAITASNNFDAILANSFVLTAVPVGKGSVVKTGLIGDTYAWKVRFPMLVSYRSSADPKKGGEGRLITDTWNMSVVVTRVGVFLNEKGLGIRSFIAQRQ